VSPAAEAIRRVTSLLRTRAALGLRPVTAPVMVFIPLGILLGPGGAGFISLNVLGHLDAVISVVLATLGVFIGIAAGTQRGGVQRLMAASSVEALITVLVVGGAVYVLLGTWGLPLDIPYVLVAAGLGISASASAAPSVEAADENARKIAGRVADLDDVLPIVLGGIVVSMLAPVERGAFAGTLLAIGLGGAIAVSGWLLIERSEGAERAVFVLGTLALLGGCAAYLGLSPLVSGLAAGWFWALTPGRTDRVIAHELRKVQHPMIVLLLVAAGAGLQASTAGVWLFAPYVVFRIAGKLIGGWVASLIAPGIAPADLGAYLIPPGVIGIAFALNIQQVLPEAAGAVVFAVSLGAIASEVVALVVTPAPVAQPAG
jgi:hypothetical protein